jgi:hypothetical protein
MGSCVIGETCHDYGNLTNGDERVIVMQRTKVRETRRGKRGAMSLAFKQAHSWPSTRESIMRKIELLHPFLRDWILSYRM